MLYIHNTSFDQKVLCCEVVLGALHRTPTCQKTEIVGPLFGSSALWRPSRLRRQLQFL